MTYTFCLIIVFLDLTVYNLLAPSDQSTKSVDADQAAQLLKPKNYVKKTANAGMPSKALSSSYISTPLKEVVGVSKSLRFLFYTIY